MGGCGLTESIVARGGEGLKFLIEVPGESEATWLSLKLWP